MYQFSDSDTTDSDDGIRFKTATTRDKQHSKSKVRDNSRGRRRSRSRERDRRRRTRSRSKSRSRHNTHKSRQCRHRTRSRSPKRAEYERKKKRLSNKSPEVTSQSQKLTKITKNNTNPSLGIISVEPTQITDDNASENTSVPPLIASPLSPSISIENDVCGPALPPHLSKPSENSNSVPEKVVGPFIPEHLRVRLAENSEFPAESVFEVVDDSETIEFSDNESSNDGYGPLPADLQKSSAHLALEERALQLKLDQLTPQQSKEAVREEWMLELPTVQAANLGLGPRQFRAKAGPDLTDRSSWTNTPNMTKNSEAKASKGDELLKIAVVNESRQRDEEQEALAKKARKKNKRDKSLLEQHQDKLNAKKKDEGKEQVRRPFNRDVDLKVNQFDDAQKKSIMKKAQLLDDRFSQGQSKFL